MFSTLYRLHQSRYPSGGCNVLILYFLYLWSFDIVFFFSVNHSFGCAIFYSYSWNCMSHPYPYLETMKCLLLYIVAVHQVLLLHLQLDSFFPCLCTDFSFPIHNCWFSQYFCFKIHYLVADVMSLIQIYMSVSIKKISLSHW